MDIDSVGVASCADGGDGCQSVGDFLPARSLHTGRVIDDKDRIKGCEKGVGVVGWNCDLGRYRGWQRRSLGKAEARVGGIGRPRTVGWNRFVSLPLLIDRGGISEGIV